VRDRALALVGLAGAALRAELAAIRVEHLEPQTTSKLNCDNSCEKLIKTQVYSPYRASDRNPQRARREFCPACMRDIRLVAPTRRVRGRRGIVAKSASRLRQKIP
jgi:hypothetical protein